ncbi:MAG: MoxR-like ATPase, partial [Gammaproteobacteria bacterium]
QNISHPINSIKACVSKDDIVELRNKISEIRVSPEIKNYIVTIIRSTRNTHGVLNGASPRASITLMKSAQALALFDGMDFITPDHIQELAHPVIAHRLMLDSQARFSGLTAHDVVSETLKSIPVPI